MDLALALSQIETWPAASLRPECQNPRRGPHKPLRIRRIILPPLDESLDINPRDQAHRLARFPEFAARATRRGASLNSDNAVELLGL